MTYRDLYEKAEWKLEKGEITGGEFDEMTKPLDEEIRPHGEWEIRKEYTKEGYDDGHGLYCSVCGIHLITLSNRGLTVSEVRDYMKNHFERNKFCFNCGADMRPRILDEAVDGEGKDGNVKEGESDE